MADLSLNAVEPRVLRDTWTRKPSLYQGGRVRCRAGNLVSTETAEKMVFECQIDLYDAAEEATLRATCVRGLPVTVDGDLPGVAFSGIVDIGDAQVLHLNVNGVALLLRAATLHIEEA